MAVKNGRHRCLKISAHHYLDLDIYFKDKVVPSSAVREDEQDFILIHVP